MKKEARVSSRFCGHRDLPFLEHSGPNLITAILCLDDMTEANGATVVLPGTHRVPLESVVPSDMDIPAEQVPPAPRVTVCSDGPRRNLISIWSGPDTYPSPPSATPIKTSCRAVRTRHADARAN